MLANKRLWGWLASGVGAAAAVTAAVVSPVSAATENQPVLQMAPGVTGNFTDNFNPFSGSAAPGTNGFIYQPLFFINNVGSGTYDFLGKSYKWSNGDKTLTVNLQQKAVWTDGVPFTSADVVYTFDLIKKYPAADTQGIWSTISSVKAAGKYQVVFQFKKVDTAFLQNIFSQDIVPQHVWSKLGDPTKANITQPVGTGPYTVSSFSSQAIKLTANPKYYLGNPPVKAIQMNSYNSNDDETLALAKNQLDWAGIFIPNIQKVYANTPEHKYWFPPSNVTMLYTNLKDPLLSQLPVREAISYGLDRTALAKTAEDGYVAAASPSGLILPNNNSWLDPSVPKSFTYNQQKAISILQQAGFKKDSNGIFANSKGQELAFKLMVVPGWSDWDSAASLIATQLAKIGIKVTVDGEQDSAYTADLNNRNFQMAISWTDAGPNPYYLFDNFVDSKGFWNVEGFKSPTVDAALNDFASTTSMAKQKKDMYTLEKTVATQLPSIPLFYAVHWNEYSTKNFTGWPTASNPYTQPDPYEWPSPAIVVMHLKPVQ